MTYKPKCITLVGLPGSGKTTWREAFLSSSPGNWQVISTDDLLENYAEEKGVTYHEAFKVLCETGKAASLVAAKIAAAKFHNYNVIWDQTNLTKQKRTQIMGSLPGHEHYHVSFLDVPLETIYARNEARRPTGRNIPDRVLEKMIAMMQPEFPTTSTELPKAISTKFGDFHD